MDMVAHKVTMEDPQVDLTEAGGVGVVGDVGVVEDVETTGVRMMTGEATTMMLSRKRARIAQGMKRRTKH